MAGTASSYALLYRLLITCAVARVSECRTAGASYHLRRSVKAHSPLATPAPTPVPTPAPAACSKLVNRETYFVIDVEIGTPGQLFSLVADTGSNTLIVPSCRCQEVGRCSRDDRCFIGTNRSSTFTVPGGQEHAQPIYLSFGSGDIGGIIVQDYARVGQLKTFMKDGLLLMTDKMLNFGGSFEGILGLGLPQPKALVPAPTQDPQQSSAGDSIDISDAIRKIMRRIQGAEDQPGAPEDATSPKAPIYLEPKEGPLSQPPGLLEQAGIDRFSMCFNYAADGVLRLGSPPVPSAHGSIGTSHWGVDLRGISVGASSIPVGICSPEDMLPGQTTACGAIPDSGTTFIMGPEDHISKLLGTLCDEWPRCSRNHSALVKAAQAADEAVVNTYGVDPFNIVPAAKDQVMKLLLMDCERWLDESGGLSELPPLHFHVQGRNGTKQTLSLPPSAYIVQSQVDKTLLAKQNLSTSLTKVCSPAFGAMNYNTAENGQVWILGTPLFYEFTVGYDLSTKPPSISFTSVDKEPCGSCDKTAGLITSNSSTRRMNRPRWITGPPRLPTSIDVKRPL